MYGFKIQPRHRLVNSFIKISLPENKKSLTENITFLSRTNKLFIRGATLIYGRAVHFTGTNIPTATNAYRYVAEYSVRIYAHLTAPSAVHLTKCILPEFQLARALCEGIFRRYFRINGLVIQIIVIILSV